MIHALAACHIYWNVQWDCNVVCAQPSSVWLAGRTKQQRRAESGAFQDGSAARPSNSDSMLLNIICTPGVISPKHS